jgi:hypothetical protein
VDGDSPDVVAPQFTLAGVQTASYLNAQFRHSFGECRGTSDSAGRSVERGQKSVARVLDFAALEASDFGPGELIVALEHLAPASVAELCSSSRRVDDVSDSTVASSRSGTCA